MKRPEVRDVVCPICGRTTVLTRYESAAYCHGHGTHKHIRMIDVATVPVPVRGRIPVANDGAV